MIGFGKGKLISVVEMAKQKELDGYENLPSKRDMTMGTMSTVWLGTDCTCGWQG